MKVKIIFIISFIFFQISVCAQTVGPKWESVYESSEQTVYIDTSSIKQFESQISVLSIMVYKKPQLIASLNQEAASIKSQLLFNAASKKYTVIGTLYYDKNLKILGETSLPGFTSESEKFSLPIEGNDAMTAVFNRSVEYLKSGLAVIELKEFSKEGEKNKEISKDDELRDKIYSQLHKQDLKDTTKAVDRVALYLSKKDSVQKAELLKLNNTKPFDDKTNVKEVLKPTNENTIEKTAAKKTEISKETNPKNMIFADGSKYSFQVSSWEKKSQAENEVQKLKRKGHNAFITEGYVRGSKWYRVRIGYFNSIEETETYMKKLK